MRSYHLSALASLSWGAAASLPTVQPPRAGEGKKSYRPKSIPRGFVPASINRHTGNPHEHKREIARRLRQAAAHARSPAMMPGCK